MKALNRASMVMAGLLVGIGIAAFAKTVQQVGFDQLRAGHIVGPGMVLAGLLRMKAQRMIDTRSRGTVEPVVPAAAQVSGAASASEVDASIASADERRGGGRGHSA